MTLDPRRGYPHLGLAAAALAALAAALLLRLPELGVRPMHGDEAVHAFKFAELWERGVYRYDPNEYHGPTIYYAALPTVWLSGRHRFGDMREADFRLATALFGAAMAPLVLLLSDGLGRRAAAAAGLLTAVSPAFVFYSRYFIQETPLAFFTLAAFACGWRYRQSGRTIWLAAAGAAAGLMIATKETALLTFAAAGLAALALGVGRWAVGRGDGTSTPHAQRPTPYAFPRRSEILLCAAVAAGVAYLFLSGFFSNPGGPLGYLETYAFWGRRGAGETPHTHPWHYYLSLLLWNRHGHEPVWSEALIVALGAFGCAAAIRKTKDERRKTKDNVDNPQSEIRDPKSGNPQSAIPTPNAQCPTPEAADPALLRFLAVYTLALAGIYSLIPYKTPWLLLSFLSALILLAGAGASAILDALRPRPAKALAALLLLGGAAHLAWQARAASTDYCTSAGNPYVYAQPSPDVVELGRQVEKIASASPEKEALIVKVIAADEYYWPLPWYLRRMRNVGYWTAMPPDTEGGPEAPFSIISSTYDPDEALNPRLPNSLMTGYYGLRAGVTFELWVRLDVWERHVRGLRRSRGAGLVPPQAPDVLRLAPALRRDTTKRCADPWAGAGRPQVTPALGDLEQKGDHRRA